LTELTAPFSPPSRGCKMKLQIRSAVLSTASRLRNNRIHEASVRLP
jgi:hypothetical protein